MDFSQYHLPPPHPYTFEKAMEFSQYHSLVLLLVPHLLLLGWFPASASSACFLLLLVPHLPVRHWLSLEPSYVTTHSSPLALAVVTALQGKGDHCQAQAQDI